MYHEQQSVFIRHGPCDSCGSKDNVAWYSNGTGFCFGCGKFYPHAMGARNGDLPVALQPRKLSTEGIRPPPYDLDSNYGTSVIEWIRKYDLKPEDLIRNNIKWSKRYEQLVYLFYGRDEEVILWQARNFRDGTDHKSRFFTGGTPEEVIATYPPKQTEGPVGVFVEDCISALKVGKSGVVGMPCFSSAVSPRKLARISKRFDHLVFWLDGDKYKESVKQAKRAELLGVKTSVIYTQLDPKDYSEQAIERYIKRSVYGADESQ